MIHYRASFSNHRIWQALVALAVTLVVGVPCVRAADQPKVTAIDQIQFQQSNAQAQMQELQERMFRLAELTREAEPDDAARLLMAVRSAREQLIIEQMRQAVDLLSNKDLSHAADEQAKIIAKLEELKKLLTTGAADLQLLLEKLRALNQAITKLDGAIKEEKRQQNASGQLGTELKDGKPADPKALTGMKSDQQQNRKTTDSIAQAVKGLGGQAAAAASSLGNASGSMSVAEGHLGAGKPSDASGQQSSAVDSMQQAKKQLNEERDKVLNELEKMVRKQIVTNLTEMLERQKSVRAGTELAVEHLTANQNQRDTLLKIKQLGTAETAIVRIADQTVTLIQETNFSVALPPALKRVQQKMAVIAATLDDGKASAKLVASEVQVERDLQDLLDTFKELSIAKIVPGSCKGCKGDHNKLEAELKVIRMMQARVNDDTRSVDGERTTVAAADLPANINPLLKEKILTVRDGQAEVHNAMEEIHRQMSAPDEPADGAAAQQPQ